MNKSFKINAFGTPSSFTPSTIANAKNNNPVEYSNICTNGININSALPIKIPWNKYDKSPLEWADFTKNAFIVPKSGTYQISYAGSLTIGSLTTVRSLENNILVNDVSVARSYFCYQPFPTDTGGLFDSFFIAKTLNLKIGDVITTTIRHPFWVTGFELSVRGNIESTYLTLTYLS